MEHEPQPLPRTFYPDKLVRDRIVGLFRAAGYSVNETQVQSVEFTLRLRAKLDEEVAELQKVSSRQDALEEAADVRSVLVTLQEVAKYDESHGWQQLAATCEAFGITMDEVIEAQQQKDEKKGASMSGTVLESFTVLDHVPDDDEWLSYFRSHPEEYPTTPRSQPPG